MCVKFFNFTQDIREAAKAVNNSLMRLIGPEDDEDPPLPPQIDQQPTTEAGENEVNEKLEKKTE